MDAMLPMDQRIPDMLPGMNNLDKCNGGREANAAAQSHPCRRNASNIQTIHTKILTVVAPIAKLNTKPRPCAFSPAKCRGTMTEPPHMAPKPAMNKPICLVDMSIP